MTILAKDDETLMEHTENTLKVLKSIKEAYPNIPELCGVDDFWNHLFYSLFFHDFGKASIEFQKVLRKEDNEWNYYRHEILSVSFIESLDIEEEYKRAIGLAIITHHKDISQLEKKYAELGIGNENGLKLFNKKLKEIEVNFNSLIDYFKFVPEFSEKYLGYSLPEPHKLNFSDLKNEFPNTVTWYHNYQEDYESDLEDEKIKLQTTYGIFLKGFVNVCDHLASSSIDSILHGEKRFKSLDTFNTLRTIQKQASITTGDTILISPTGSGKTEAALLWAMNNQNNLISKRVFYFLPFTASINAMYERLQKEYDEKLVGLIHGKSSYFIYKTLTEGTYEEKRKYIRKINSLTKNIYKPYKILTPFQIIKYFFQVKGYEMGLSELTNSLLIFDEIHAYDSHTTALILSILSILKKEYNVTILIMSATLPNFLKELFAEELNIKNVIELPLNELDTFTRHEVNILSGTIFENMDKIINDICNNKKVLVICNTVQTSQELYEQLKIKNSALLHSRFILKDREKIEKNLSNLNLLVGTQAIEVSLNISYDVLYTEPAPLDALIQRFGRVNRTGWKKHELKPVYVCQFGSEYDKYIYDEEIVQKTLNLLENINILYESKIQELIDKVYGSKYNSKDQEEFQKTKDSFSKLYDTFSPFINNKNNEKIFYNMFKSYEVVPTEYQEIYLKLIENKEFYNAMSYVLHISSKQFMIQKKKHNINFEEDTYFLDIEYDSKLGLQLNKEKDTIM